MSVTVLAVGEDDIWGEALQAAAQRGVSAEDLEREFVEWAGFSSAEATAAELVAFLQRSPTPGGPSGPAPRLEGQPLDGPDGWIRVTGTALSQPVDVRVAMRAGRPRIVGIRVDNDQEVTADFLRQIRVGEILGVVLSWGELGEPPNLAGVKFKEREIVIAEWAAPAIFLQELPAVGPDETTSAKRGTPPPDSALRNFARTYLQRLAVKPHGAMAAAAREVHIARSTAYRWAELCRERGYLPQEGGQDG